MNKYALIALRTVELVNNKDMDDPVEAWYIAAKEIFKDSESSIKKGCPRNAFLGL